MVRTGHIHTQHASKWGTNDSKVPRLFSYTAQWLTVSYSNLMFFKQGLIPGGFPWPGFHCISDDSGQIIRLNTWHIKPGTGLFFKWAFLWSLLFSVAEDKPGKAFECRMSKSFLTRLTDVGDSSYPNSCTMPWYCLKTNNNCTIFTWLR